MSPRTHALTPVIIDVRPEADYLGKGTSIISKKAPDLGAINIPWTQFITAKGEANYEIGERLRQIAITTDRDLVLIDDQGVRSAMATLVLRELGFSKATNFAGGYLELLGMKLK